MKRLLWLAVGLAALVALAAAVLRGSGVGARRDPFPLESRIARASWRWLVPREIRAAVNPIPATPEQLKAAREHWADHCAICHANNGSGETTIGRAMYPSAPDMRSDDTQSLTDGELFYAIEEGIPWTGMPAWGNGTPQGERGSWQLVRFIRHLPGITGDELREMEQFNPRSPAQEHREREIEDFLKGPAPHEHGQGRGKQ